MRFVSAVVVVLAALALAGSAGATTYNTLTIDGSCSDWNGDEFFPTTDTGGNPAFDFRLTWDANNVYLGWTGGDTSGNKRREAAFDMNKGTADGSDAQFQFASFGSQGQPEYAVEYSFGASFGDFLYFSTRNGDNFDEQALGFPGTPDSPLADFDSDGCGGQPFAEVALPRSLFEQNQSATPNRPNPPVSDLTPADDLGIYSWYVENEGIFMGTMPAANQNSTFLIHEAYCPTTGDQLAPNLYCATTGTAVRLSSFAVRGRTITWRTATENGVLGFQVWRDGRRLNRSLIAAYGSAAGAAYRLVDRSAPRGSHLYRLRVIRTDGTVSWAASARSA